MTISKSWLVVLSFIIATFLQGCGAAVCEKSDKEAKTQAEACCAADGVGTVNGIKDEDMSVCCKSAVTVDDQTKQVESKKACASTAIKKTTKEIPPPTGESATEKEEERKEEDKNKKNLLEQHAIVKGNKQSSESQENGKALAPNAEATLLEVDETDNKDHAASISVDVHGSTEPVPVARMHNGPNGSKKLNIPRK